MTKEELTDKQQTVWDAASTADRYMFEGKRYIYDREFVRVVSMSGRECDQRLGR